MRKTWALDWMKHGGFQREARFWRREESMQRPALDEKGTVPPLSLEENWGLVWMWEQELSCQADGLKWAPTAVS